MLCECFVTVRDSRLSRQGAAPGLADRLPAEEPLHPASAGLLDPEAVLEEWRAPAAATAGVSQTGPPRRHRAQGRRSGQGETETGGKQALNTRPGTPLRTG